MTFVATATAGTITIDAANITSFQAAVGKEDIQMYSISGSGFQANQRIYLEASDLSESFTIAESSSTTFVRTFELIADSDGNFSAAVNIRYRPTGEGPHLGTISHSAANTETKDLQVDGNTVTLAVEWAAFDVSIKEKKIYLEWVTAHETNNHYFHVELMKDLMEGFEKIGKVGSKVLNSRNPIWYEFEYPFTGGGKVWYVRLQQVGLDGTFTYSKILPIALPAAKGINLKLVSGRNMALQLQVNVSEAGQLHIAIVNVSGNVVYNTSYNLQIGENTFEVQSNTDIPGMYILSAAFKGEYDQVKFYN